MLPHTGRYFCPSCLKRGENGRRAKQMKHALAVGRNMLVVTGARTELASKLIIGSTESPGRGEAIKPAHTSDPAFDAPAILLEPIIPEQAGAVGSPLPSLERIAPGEGRYHAIRGDPVRDDADCGPG